MSFVDVLLLLRASPERARSLLTVRAAISPARLLLCPRRLALSLMCSYWRSRFRLDPAGISATFLGQVPPAGGGNLDVMAFGGGEDPLPRPVPLSVADAFNLVEAGDRVAHMPGVGQRLLALVGEGEVLVRQPVFFRGAYALAAARDLRAVCPGALRLPGLGDVAPGGLFLPGGGHHSFSQHGFI